VGTTAQYCVERGLTPREIASDRSGMSQLQQTLLRDDQTIRGVRNNDPEDLARNATVRASAQEPDSPAANILDGVTRDLPNPAIHRWAARLGAGGCWIELAWPKPQRLRQVQITFDSGFQRELTLSSSDATMRGIVRAAQPETAKDYSVLLRRPGSAELAPVAEVRGNHQRLRRHSFEPMEADAVRIHITATNGDELARIFEVRCYG
jgi:hypothetical protein